MDQRSKTSVVVAQETNNPHRTFKWLPWHAGNISVTPLNCDVLTGPMSGCILVTFRENGVVKVGHIGTVTETDAPTTQANIDVKTIWNNFALANPHDVIGGSNPVDISIPLNNQYVPNDGGPETWGLFTSDGSYYAVHVMQNKFDMNFYRIAGLHRALRMSIASLQNL